MSGHVKSSIDKTRGTLSERFTSPIRQFMALEVSGGILLVFVTIIAMTWANSSWAEAYFHFFHTPIALTIGNFYLEHSLLHWVNDLLMAIFFFVVGLEIKREMVSGELSSWKKASLPLFAALGGMIAPAIFYYSMNPDGAAAAGWGIPMATDIAFAVGIMMLLGNRVPFALKVFLLALAIADDLGAILVIALFYTKSLSVPHLIYALGGVIAILGLRAMGVWRKIPYLLVGAFMWLMVLKSGVHATVAGVALGFLTPAYPIVNRRKMFDDLGHLIDKMRSVAKPVMTEENDDTNEPLGDETKALVDDIKYVAHEAEPPLDNLMHMLHPWVTFVIMPIFALGNAGIALTGVEMGDIFNSPVSLGVMLGLFLGKPLGIMLFSFLAVKLKVSSLPQGISWSSYMGMSCLAGIGFTMALFVGNLALGGSEYETFSKLGILIGSLLSAVVGYVVLYMATGKPNGASNSNSSDTAA
jgi:NhaA family Na+:H+ antiporter